MKKSKILLAIFIGMIGLAIVSSCGKDENVNLTKPSNTKELSKSKLETEALATEAQDEIYIYKYYLDNVIVNNITSNLESDNWILYLATKAENSNEVTVEVRKFTNKSDYIEYGRLKNIPIERSLRIGDILRTRAEETGVITQYENTGEIPQWYIDFESTTYSSNFNNNVGQNRNLWIQLYKECRRTSGTIPMVNTYPFMPPTWNNAVSMNEVVGFYAGTSVYDKTFYRKHLGTVWLIGISTLCWNGLIIDDAMSSGIKLL